MGAFLAYMGGSLLVFVLIVVAVVAFVYFVEEKLND